MSSDTFTASLTSSPSSSSAASSISSTLAVTTMSSMGSSTTSPPTSTSVSTYIPNPSCDPISNNVVMNGNFSCGLDPWVASAGPFNTFQLAFHSLQYVGPGYYNPGAIIPTLSQQITLTVGQAYTLTFTTLFGYCSGETTLKTFLGDITDCQFPAGTGHTNTFSFIATTSSVNLNFAFIDSSHSGSTQTIEISEGMYTHRAQLLLA